MRLHEVIAVLDEEELQDLKTHCVPRSSTESLPLLREEIEARIRQPDYIEGVVFARRPPALAILVEMLEADGLRRPAEELTERVRKRAARWRSEVTSGDLLANDDKRDLYRKLLRAAWANDLQIDASEASLLGLLRQELGLSRSEHFLLAFHKSISHLWDESQGPEELLRVLREHGLIWRFGSDVVLAEETEAPIRRATGVELNRSAYLRLLDRLNATVTRDVLTKAGIRRSGSKAELAERVADNLIAPSVVLDSDELNRVDLVSLARALDIQSSGRKRELAVRIVDCFRTGADLTAGKVEVQEELPVEPKALDEMNFMVLFRPLSNHELHALLGRLDLPLSGTKEIRIAQLWTSRFCEATILKALKGDVLGRICQEHGVSRAGKKVERIERLLEHLASQRTESSKGPEEDLPKPVSSALDDE